MGTHRKPETEGRYWRGVGNSHMQVRRKEALATGKREFTLDLEAEDGGNVISIEVARKHLFERRCKHHRIRIDPEFTHIECRDCKQQLNPVEWLSVFSTEWNRIKRLYKTYHEAKKLYDEKQRTQCQHCKRITRVTEPSNFSKRLREREQQR